MLINSALRAVDYSSMQANFLLAPATPAPIPTPPQIPSDVKTEDSPLSNGKTTQTTVPWTKRDEKTKPTWPTTVPTHGDKLVGVGSGTGILQLARNIPSIGALPTLITDPGAFAHPIDALKKDGNVNPLLTYAAVAAGVAVVAPEALVAVGVGAALKFSLFS